MLTPLCNSLRGKQSGDHKLAKKCCCFQGRTVGALCSFLSQSLGWRRGTSIISVAGNGLLTLKTRGKPSSRPEAVTPHAKHVFRCFIAVVVTRSIVDLGRFAAPARELVESLGRKRRAISATGVVFRYGALSAVLLRVLSCGVASSACVFKCLFPGWHSTVTASLSRARVNE